MGSRVRVPDAGGTYLVIDPTLGVPGGYVTTVINPGQLTGSNTTTTNHVFVGTVNVQITINSDGSAVYSASGSGITPGLLGPSRDFVNELLGGPIFSRMGIDNVMIAGATGICDRGIGFQYMQFYF